MSTPPQKKPRFAKFKKATSPAFAPVDPNMQTAKVVLVKPDCESSLIGVVISPTGFQMDRFLGNILYKKGVTLETTEAFLKETKCIHRVLKVKAEDGTSLVKYNDNKFYTIQSVLIPVDDETDIDTPEKVKNIVANFGLALWKAIDKKTFGFAKFEECPSIRDYDRDVRTVTNYSDIIEGNEDILVVHRLALSKEGLKLKDWLNAEGEDTLYTLFKRGNVPPELVTPYAIPFYKMDPKDQKAFQEWCLANGTPARKSAPGTPGHKGTPTITSLGAIQANENSPAVAPTRSLDKDLSNEQDE